MDGGLLPPLPKVKKSLIRLHVFYTWDLISLRRTSPGESRKKIADQDH